MTHYGKVLSLAVQPTKHSEEVLAALDELQKKLVHEVVSPLRVAQSQAI